MELIICLGWLLIVLGAVVSVASFLTSQNGPLLQKAGWIIGIGGITAVLVAGLGVLSGGTLDIQSGWFLPVGGFILHGGSSEGLMLVLLNLVGVLVFIAQPWNQEPLETAAFLILVAALGVCLVARDILLFLMAWEIMALTGVVFLRGRGLREDRNEGDSLWAYLVSAHLATLCLLVLLPLVYILGGNRFELGKPLIWKKPFEVPVESRWIWSCVALTIAGFGIKAGLAPFHSWVKRVYRYGPAWFGAVSSGLMAKVSLFLMFRTLLELIPGLGPDRLPWLGGILMVLGLVSGLIGLAGALSSARIRVILGYSSVENVGIILIGFGLGLWGVARESWSVALFGFSGSFFHLINHMITKSLLFLASASVANGTGTDDLARLGGILKRMPVTGRAFGLGSLSLAAMVPLNAFSSELLIYNGLFLSVLTLGTIGRDLAIFSVVVMGLVGGLAAVCFTGLWGLGFLGNARSEFAESATEDHLGKRGKFVLNLISIIIVGLGLAPVLGLFIVQSTVSQILISLGCPEAKLQQGMVSAAILLGYLSIVGLMSLTVVFLLKRWRDSRLAESSVQSGLTWDCGFGYVDSFARGQYSGLSYFEPLLPFVSRLAWIRIHHPDLSAPFPEPARVRVESTDGLIIRFYEPVYRAIGRQLSKLRWIQAGSIQLYLAMMALTLISMLFWLIVF